METVIFFLEQKFFSQHDVLIARHEKRGAQLLKRNAVEYD